MPLPDWISRAGSAAGQGLSDVGSGLAAAAPYALPAALGAGIGALSGRGTLATGLGGLAGGLAAKGEQSEAEEKSKDTEAELDLKRQQLHIEAQKSDIEIQEGQLALNNAKDAAAYRKKITDPNELALWDSGDKKAWAAYKGWNSLVDTTTKDPSWDKLHPDLDAKLLKLAGPEGGPKLIEASRSGKFANGKNVQYNADGTYTVFGVGPSDPATGKPGMTPILSGVMPKTVASATAEKPADAKALMASFRLIQPAPSPPGSGLIGKVKNFAGGKTPEEWANDATNYLVANGVPADKASQVARSSVGLKGEASSGGPTIPPGSKPVYDASGKLVGYKHD